MLELGINPLDDDVIEHFIAFRDAYHHDWHVVLKNFEAMIRDVIEGKSPARYPPPPPPWKELPNDAILHLLATKIYESMDELIEGLECYGIYVAPEEMRGIVKKEWTKKPIMAVSNAERLSLSSFRLEARGFAGVTYGDDSSKNQKEAKISHIQDVRRQRLTLR